MFLQFFESFPHIRRNFVQVFLCFDRAAKQEKSLRIFRGQDLFAVNVFDAQFTIVIGTDDLRFANVDVCRFDRAPISR